MADRYKTESDIVLRLHETVVRYKGKCYLARAVGEGLYIDLFRPENQFKTRLFRISGNDPELDISSIDVGFMQHSNATVLLISRGPFRKQKQGLSTENLVYKVLSSMGDREGFRPVSSGIISSEEFFSMLDNDYPTYAIAHEEIKTLKVREVAKAFNKKLAVALDEKEGKMQLYLNSTIIAEKKKEDTHWHISEAYNNTTTAMYLVSKGVPIY